MKPDESVPKIVLIGGSGRSGTNITKSILAKHSRVHALPFEHRITVDPDGLVDFYRTFEATWSPYLADHRIKELKRFLMSLGKSTSLKTAIGKLIRSLDPHGNHLAPSSYNGWNLSEFFPNYNSHVTGLVDNLVDFQYPATWVGTQDFALSPRMLYSGPREKTVLAHLIGEFINSLVADCLRVQAKDVFVEDNTWNILFAADLLEFTPQAKVIHVFRDPRDVVSSLMHQRWAPKKAVEAATWYSDIMRTWNQNKAVLAQGRFLEVSLEDLAHETTKTVNMLCNFLGLEIEANMAEFDKERAHLGRWKQDLTQEEVTAIQPILDPWIKDLGYAF